MPERRPPERRPPERRQQTQPVTQTQQQKRLPGQQTLPLPKNLSGQRPVPVGAGVGIGQIGHTVNESPGATVNGDINVKIVTAVKETLRSLGREMEDDRENGRLSPEQVGELKSYMDHLLIEIDKVNEGKLDKNKLLNYLKKIMDIAGYVTKNVTTVGTVATTFGDVVREVENLPLFKK